MNNFVILSWIIAAKAILFIVVQWQALRVHAVPTRAQYFTGKQNNNLILKTINQIHCRLMNWVH